MDYMIYLYIFVWRLHLQLTQTNNLALYTDANDEAIQLVDKCFSNKRIVGTMLL